MKKKLILFVSALLVVCSLCACGNTSDTEDYNGLTSADIQMAMEQTANTLLALSDEECQDYYEYYLAQEDGEIYADLMENWIEIKPEIGEFESVSDFEITKAGKTISAVLTMQFSQRDVTLTYVMEAHSMEVTAVNADIVYSLKEKMSNAALNTVMGIVIVFAVLILICLCIYAFRIIPKLQNRSKGETESEEKKSENAAVQAAVAPVTAVAGEDDPELIAVIAAAIAAATGTSTDAFVVRSIKRRFKRRF